MLDLAGQIGPNRFGAGGPWLEVDVDEKVEEVADVDVDGAGG